MLFRKVFFCLVFSLGLVGLAHAQSREAGIRFSGLSNFDFMYKHPSKAGNFHRWRLASVNASALSRTNSTELNFGLGLAYGYEKRKYLADHTYFIHGWEPAIFGDFRSNGQFVSFQLAYVLGLQYNFHQRFYINLELAPSIGINGNFLAGNDPVYIAGLNLDSRFVSLSLIHQF